MSMWALPNTTEKAELLRQAMERPIEARRAVDEIGHLAAADNLLDRIEDARIWGSRRDVRGLVSNWVSQMIFSWEDTRRIPEEAVDILWEISSRKYEGKDLFPELHRHGEQEFRTLLREVSFRPKEDSQWQVVSDDGSPDLFALSDDGEMYRFCRLDGMLLDIKAINQPRFMHMFEPALEPAP